MKKFYKIFRAFAVTLLSIVIALPLVLYIILSLSGVQNLLKETAQKELSQLLNTPVEIGSLSLDLPSRLVIEDVAVKDSADVNAMWIDRIDAAIEIMALWQTKKIIITLAEIEGLKVTLYKETPDSKLNINHIIEALKPKDKEKPPTKFDLRIGHVLLRKASLTYDVKSTPATAEGVFDVNHIAIDDINLNLLLPRIKNDDFSASLRRMSLTERSGLRLSNLQFQADVTDKSLSVNGLTIRMPGTSLLLDDLALFYNGYGDIADALSRDEHSVGIKDGSYVTPADLAPLLPVLAGLKSPVDLSVAATGSLNNGIYVNNLNVASSEYRLAVRMANVRLLGLDRDIARNIDVNVDEFEINADAGSAVGIAENFTRLPGKTGSILKSLGVINASGKGSYTQGVIAADVTVSTEIGEVIADVTAALPKAGRSLSVAGTVSTTEFDVATLLNDNKLPGKITMTAEADLAMDKPYPAGEADIHVDHIEYRGYDYSDITVTAKSHDRIIYAKIDSNDPHADVNVEGHLSMVDIPSTEFFINAANIDLAALNLSNNFKYHKLAFVADASISGENINTLDGWLRLNNVRYINDLGQGINLNRIDIDADCASTPKEITIDSDVIEGSIYGSFNFNAIATTWKDIVGHFLPALVGEHHDSEARHSANLGNDFNFDFVVKENGNLEKMLNLPVSIEAPIKINGKMSYLQHVMQLAVDAPFLLQKDKIITGTALTVNLDGNENQSDYRITTCVPTKRGDMTLNIGGTLFDNTIKTRVDWLIKNEHRFVGDLNFTTTMSRISLGEEHTQLATHVDVNPGEAVFNDTLWTVFPATVDILPKNVTVKGFKAGHEDQMISIDGTAAADTTSMLRLSLRDIDLDYIFSTLNIPNVMFGGNATGDFYASGLFSGEPRIYTPVLDVKGLSYNGCVMGDGTILSAWDTPNKAVTIDAVINQADGRQSKINGMIKPMDEELDFVFDADHAPVGFLQPFMEAFAGDVQGHASGKAHLYGTFKLIDMTGDLMADDIKLKLDFTNVYYSASDSVHIRPGRIEFEDIELLDQYGNSGRLSGVLTHECFKKPVFNFRVTDVKNMLVYDIPETTEQRWYGKVYGNGSASVSGRPGIVNIKVNMTTAPNSTFTFVLSDAEVASDYTFVTFRDRDKPRRDSIMLADPSTALLLDIEKRRAANKQQEDAPSIYNMNINVNVTPDAAVNLIMDPIGGDCIKARGQGTMAMDYNSSTEELKMRGSYTLNQGSYNFTLQDIIIKPFTIEPGSSITFNGDPYAAQLNITAAYQLNANLTDLDESFASDKELNRTNVPVRALLIAKGDMRHPDISFDLNFPTLTQDTYSKVKSIVSTDEMMNRQIIYLLALNRFYTPDYMASTTKGNELVSVASSTISSQLSSMLGSLSENWSIAPNFRSDRGDFSDVEVDVALSSHLLNNRLLLNGNFGYRDKSLNNNSFIGDFDVEYLLNRSGTIRLKAYNRYNDQNFYVKNALTTQGIGVVFKRDFDNLFSFLKKSRRKSVSVDTVKHVDKVMTSETQTDSINVATDR
ncbi:MAG: translocation/assembly module TamB domain-containing protein [Muribaculaceae bacterium]|nr:translocation/assembly module TamB domain-containing protein [Muribaculaceae bacterium]